MLPCFKFIVVTIAACFVVSCAEPGPTAITSAVKERRMQKVRTTAYTRSEGGSGRHNAIGTQLSDHHIMSAASDWSRFPLGTRFRIVGTNEHYVIDDYGTALVGTNTIDLYKPSRLEMRRWGVRYVDIDIVQWGSAQQSLKVLAPRAKHRIVRQMIMGLQKKPLVSSTSNRATID